MREHVQNSGKGSGLRTGARTRTRHFFDIKSFKVLRAVHEECA